MKNEVIFFMDFVDGGGFQSMSPVIKEGPVYYQLPSHCDHNDPPQLEPHNPVFTSFSLISFVLCNILQFLKLLLIHVITTGSLSPSLSHCFTQAVPCLKQLSSHTNFYNSSTDLTARYTYCFSVDLCMLEKLFLWHLTARS